MTGAIQWLKRLCIPSIVLLLVCGTPWNASGFSSYVPFVHDNITRAAAASVGWNDEGRKDELAEEVRNVDWDETNKLILCAARGERHIQPNSAYVAAHHFDCPPSASTAGAFLAGQQWLRACYLAAKSQSGRGGNTALRIKYLGRLCHALEDVFSHSNYVDLSCSDKLAVRSALLGSMSGVYAVPPASFVLTTYCADSDYDPMCGNCDLGMMHADCHDRNCKDKLHMNGEAGAEWLSGTACGYSGGGNTKFALAYDCAVDAVAAALRDFPMQQKFFGRRR